MTCGDITLFSGEQTGIEVTDASPFFDQNTYCFLDVEQIETFSTPVAVHFWLDNLNTPSDDKWHGWVSLTNYTELLDNLDQLTFDKYDNVTRTPIAYTRCTSQSAICLVCDTQIPHQSEDVVELTYAKGPLYIHKDCLSELYDTLVNLQTTHATEFIALTI